MSKNIDVYTTGLSLSEDDVRGKTVIVVDVLRASSTIITALSNNAKSVIPVADMGEASKIAQNLDPSGCLLCGERDGKQIEGYDLGNSPSEYTNDVVEGKTLILTTTNGTRAISRSTLASKVIVAGFLNAAAVAKSVIDDESEIIIVCAGWKGRLSLEDVLCAGYIVSTYYEGNLPDDAKDGAKVAFGLYDRYKDTILDTVSVSNHAKRLVEMGYGEDIAYCCELNKFQFVPVVDEGIIRI
ncbi:MAG: 2-phosphosulfolactate phosphatase [Balneolales bacterium]|nr:2-phosphosulfolactate phosphatase [Balneolales bacterium]